MRAHLRTARRHRLLKLEPRLLFDGAAAAEALDVSGDSDSPVTDAPDTTATPVAMDPARHEIAFVDVNLPNWEAIAAAVGDQAEVVFIAANRDGVDQINDALAGRNDLDALHIYSHGETGAIRLGSSVLNTQTLDARATDIAAWGTHLTDQADILLYGCDVAGDAAGTQFAEQLAALTGADVAASIDDTGDASEDGNWTLEYSSGPIETRVIAVPGYGARMADTADGFGDNDYNGDASGDPIRMITWNVIGLDSNKPATEGPDMFMVGVRVETDSAGLSGYTVKIVDDDGKDVFGTGLIFADNTAVTTDFDDGVDNITFPNRTAYTDVNIAANSYQDFYFNVEVLRDLSSIDQIQPFHFEVFKDTNNDGNWDATEAGRSLEKFSWLPDSAAANTPLYLYVEHYISQARNDVTNQTYPDADAAAIRIDGYTNGSGGYDTGTVTVFVGQTLDLRVEAQTATQGYPQLTVSTVFDTEVFQILESKQYYDQPVTDPTYQQDLGTGSTTTLSYDPFDYTGGDASGATTGDANTSVYANPAGWNPATHSLMITSAPPKAGGGPIVTDYRIEVTGTGGGALSTLILDYSGSSFHYNADLNNGELGFDVINFDAVKGTIVGTVKADTNGDGVGDSAIAGVTISLSGVLDENLNGIVDVGETTVVTATTTTDANGNYVFTDLLPGVYTVLEGATNGYLDVSDTDGAGNGDNTVTVVIGPDVLKSTAAGLGLTGATAARTDASTETLAADDNLGYQRADFVEAQPDLALSKTVDSQAPQVGSTVTFTLTVSNDSFVAAPWVQVADQLPAGLTFVSASGDGSYDAGTGLWTLAGGVAAGSTQSIDITVTVDSDAAITNFAEIVAVKTGASGTDLNDPDSTPDNNNGGTRTPFEDDEARITIDASEADLGLVKTWANVTSPGDRPSVGDTLSFTLLVTNSGPDDATGVVVTDHLPASLGSFSNITPSVGSFDANTGVWTVGSIANGDTVSLSFHAVLTSAAAFNNFAEVTASDQFDPDSTPDNDNGDRTASEDDEARVNIVPHASDLSLSKVVSDRAPDVGENVTYTLILTNSGPDDATNVVVTDYLPAGVTWVSGGTYNGGTNTVEWNAGSVAVGQTVTLDVVVTVNQTGTLTNFAEVTASDQPDPDSTANNDGGAKTVDEDDEASATLSAGATDLSLAKSWSVDDGTLDAIGDVVTFTLSVTNSGTKDAYNVQVEDLLQSGLSYLSTVSGGTGTYTPGTGIWSVGTVLAGETKTISFKATVTDLLAKTNYAEIIEADAAPTDAIDGSSTLADVDSTFDNDAGNRTADEDDEALVTLPRIPYADLQITNVIDNSNPGANATVTFTLTVTNTGVDTADNIQVSFVFPDGTGGTKQLDNPTFGKSDATDTVTYTSPGGTWTIGQLAYGESATLTLTTMTPSGSGSDTFVNDLELFAQVSNSSLPDPDSTVANNAGGDALGNANDGTRTPYEDDEAISVAIASGSSRVDVAITNTVAVTDAVNTPKGSTSALVSGDKVTYTITALNQGGDADNPVVFDAWATGELTLETISQNASNGKLYYSTDNGTNWTLIGTGTSTFNVNLDTITHLKWNPYNTGANTKFGALSTSVLTITATVTSAGATSNAIDNDVWWNYAGSGSDADSSFPDATLPTTNDLATDDLSDGLADDDEASVTIGGSQQADLSLTKQMSIDGGQTWSSAESLVDGTVVTFRLSITNDATSNDRATGVIVQDALPTGLVYLNQYGSGSYDAGTGLWSVGSVDVGQTRSIYILAEVDWDAIGGSTLTNYAQVSASDQPDADSTPNDNSSTDDDDDSVTITKDVLDKADLSLTKLVDNASPDVGDTVTYTLTVSNAGPLDATGVVVKDLLPSALSFVSSTGDGAYDAGTGLWTVGTITNGSSAQMQITVRVTGTDSISNFAQIQASDQPDPDSTPGNDGDDTDNEDDEAKATVNPRAADLSLSKVVSNATPNVGDTITFTLTVVNGGPNDAGGVEVTDLLPAGFLSGVSATSPSGHGSYDTGTGVWSLGTVAVGDIARLTITGTVASAQAITNYAEITASDIGDPDSTPDNDNGDRSADEDDEADVTVTPVAADLQLSKSVDNATPGVGENVVFTLTVINAGPNDATNVEITDYLPAGMTYVSDDGTTTLTGSELAWSVGNLAVGEVRQLHITATITSDAAISNFAQVTAVDQFDPDSTKNNDSGRTADEDDEAAVTVDARQADLSINKTVSKADPMVGETITFTVTVTNNSSDDATGVEITDTLPDGFTFVSATGGAVHTDNGASADTLVWSGLTVGAYSSRSFTVTVVADSATALTNVAAITASDLPDPDNSNDSDDATADGQLADLALTKSVVVSDQATAETDGYYKATFTLTLTNDGPDAATHVVVADALPAGLSFMQATASAGSFSAATGLWSLDSMGSGNTATLTLVTRVTSAASITNTAWVAAADQPDPDSDPGDNTGSDDKNDSLPDDDEDSATVDVAMVDLSLAKSIDNQNPTLGSTVTYTVTLSNATGFDTATGVQVTESLPAGLNVTSVTPSSGSYSGGVWSVASLAGGASATLTITGTVTDLSALMNVAEVTACDQFDIDSTPDNRDDEPGEDDTANAGPSQLVMITGAVLDDRNGFVPDTFDAGDTPIAGVTISVFAASANPLVDSPIASTTTNANGIYTLYVPAGSYLIVQTDKAGYISVASLQAINPLSGALTLDTSDPGHNQKTLTTTAGNEYYENNFLDLTPWSIGGKVYNDADSDSAALGDADDTPLAGVTVDLYRATGAGTDNVFGTSDDVYTQVATTTTDASGAYQFGSLGAGLYRVDETNPTGYGDVTDRDGGTTATEKNQVAVVLQRGAGNVTNADFLDVQTVVPVPPTLTTPDENGAATGQQSVVENATLTGKSFTLTAADGLASISVGGTTVTAAQLANLGTTPVSIITAKGTLTLTGYNSGTGAVTYSYDPAGTTTDHSGGEVTDDFAITVTDLNSATANGTLSIQILDTAPVAVADAGSITEDASPNTVTGNVMTGTGSATADTLGADTTTVVGVAAGNTGTDLDGTGVNATITGSHGTIVIDANGNYTYTLDNTDPAVQALNNGQSLTDVFTYTIKDSDGDLSHTTVTITINGADDGADLVTVKSLASADATPDEGDTVSFTIEVTNRGSAQATGVHLTEQWPTGLLLTGSSASQGSFDANTGQWQIGTLANNASATLTLTGQVKQGFGGQQVVNRVTAATGDQPDPTTAGDDLSEAVQVGQAPTLTFTPSVPFAAPIEMAPVQTLMTTVPAQHVLAAVAQTRAVSEPGSLVADSGELDVRTSATTLGTDPSLHVLPAIAAAQSDVRYVAYRVESIAGNEFTQPAFGNVFDTVSDGERDDEEDDRRADPSAAAPDAPPADAPADAARDTEPASDEAPAPATASPAAAAERFAHRSFTQQLRQASSVHSTRHAADQLQAIARARRA